MTASVSDPGTASSERAMGSPSGGGGKHRCAVHGQHTDLVPHPARAPIPERLGVAPFERIDMTGVAGCQLVASLSIGRGNEDPTGRRVAHIRGADVGQLATVRRPGRAAELTHSPQTDSALRRIARRRCETAGS